MENQTLERYLQVRNPSEREIDLFTQKISGESEDPELIELGMFLYTSFNGNYTWDNHNVLSKTDKKIGNIPKARKFPAEIVLPPNYETFDRHFEEKSAIIKVHYNGRDISGVIVGLELTSDGYITCGLAGFQI